MSDRGEYRPFFGSILDDPDFQAMPGDTFKVFFVLKHMLGPAGIGVPRHAEIAEVCGKTLPEIADAMEALEQPKPEEEFGWILRERNVVWLVNGLRHELLKPNNHPHREAIARQLRAVGDKPIVRKFRAYYPQWFDRNGMSPEGPSQGAKRDPTRDPEGSLEGVKRHKTKRNETKQDEKQNETTARARDGSLEGPSQGPSEFLDTFYADASPARRAKIEAQLADALSPRGALVKDNDFAKAKDIDHLRRCIGRTIAEAGRIRNPDAAIVVLLRKLQSEEKDNRGRYPGEVNVDREKATIAQEESYDRARRAAANEWARKNAGELEKLERTARINCPAEGDLGDLARNSWLLQEISNRLDFPAYEDWLADRDMPALT